MVNFNVFSLSPFSLAKVSISLTCHLRVQIIALLQEQRMLAYCYSARSVKFGFSAIFLNLFARLFSLFHPGVTRPSLEGSSLKTGETRNRPKAVHFDHYTPSSSDLLWEIVEKQKMIFT